MSFWEAFLLGILASILLMTVLYRIVVYFMELDEDELMERMEFYFESLNDEEQKEYRLIVKKYRDLVIKVSKVRIPRKNRRVSRLEKRKTRIENKIRRIKTNEIH